MKFALDQNQASNVIHSYEPGKIQVRGTVYESCLLVSASKIVTDWATEDCTSLSPKALNRIIEMQPHILIIGTGTKQVFPEPKTLIPLMDAGIGYEIMDTGAACRTYNVLLSEDRNVMALLIP